MGIAIIIIIKTSRYSLSNIQMAKTKILASHLILTMIKASVNKNGLFQEKYNKNNIWWKQACMLEGHVVFRFLLFQSPLNNYYTIT